MRKYLIVTLFAGAAVTIAFAAVYAAVQQNYRQTANDPQIQIADDAVNALDSGYSLQTLIAGLNSGSKIDMSKSLSAFMIVFDENGRVIASTGAIEEASSTGAGSVNVPTPPTGVLDFARTHSDNRVTWQLTSGERFATVVKYWKGQTSSGFILVGRSLREIENRELQTELIVGGAWLVMLILGIGTVALIRYLP